jgi:ring-1,2-phenylacetyl-CoA epoxidase subunit PaaC
MKDELKEALGSYLLTLADDELILGHRNSEWCGHAPILEEDIAFANIALDEIGHAILWYELAADVAGEDRKTFPDRQVYFREPAGFRCVQLVELPRGDWAFTMLRQYLFDVLEMVRLEQLAHSAYRPLAEVTLKIRGEELYHLRHTRAWVRRLGLGTEESHHRMQTALDQLWPYVLQLFAPLTGEAALLEANYIPSQERLKMAWSSIVIPYLHEAGLKVPNKAKAVFFSREHHSEYLVPLLRELQQVARLDPTAKW